MRPLDTLRGIERATVLKAGTPAGTLERQTESVVFAYDSGYLAAAGEAVATTLPLSAAPVVTHAPGALPPFFSGLLPEGRRLTALRGAVKTSSDDEFTLLLAVGGDAIGNVQVLPAGEQAVDVEPRVLGDDWGAVRFADLFETSVGGGDAGIDRVALPGVQDKVSARMINVPVTRAGRPLRPQARSARVPPSRGQRGLLPRGRASVRIERRGGRDRPRRRRCPRAPRASLRSRCGPVGTSSNAWPRRTPARCSVDIPRTSTA